MKIKELEVKNFKPFKVELEFENLNDVLVFERRMNLSWGSLIAFSNNSRRNSKACEIKDDISFKLYEILNNKLNDYWSL